MTATLLLAPEPEPQVMSAEEMSRVMRRNVKLNRNLSGSGRDRQARAGNHEPKLKAKTELLAFLLHAQKQVLASNARGEIIPGQRDGRRRLRMAIRRTRHAIDKCAAWVCLEKFEEGLERAVKKRLGGHHGR